MIFDTQQEHKILIMFALDCGNYGWVFYVVFCINKACIIFIDWEK